MNYMIKKHMKQEINYNNMELKMAEINIIKIFGYED